jgi:glycosyltransferase-like protein LARGE
MGQPNISPYYFKAAQVTRSKDITLSTIVTNDRFPVLSRLASHYKGR